MDFAGKQIDLSQPQVMGVINVTPDSFSDGGTLYNNDKLCVTAAIARAAAMVAEGASFLDVGGESTRPGASAVNVDEELSRTVPVIEALSARFDAVISIDSSHADVISGAVQAGAGFINDVRALQKEGALAAAAAAVAVPVCLMHIQGEPKTMQEKPQYDDVVEDIGRYFQQRIQACKTAGIDQERIIIDPGFGFGKSLVHNLTLVQRLAELKRLDLPMLVGMSRKRMIGAILDKSVEQRVDGGLALAVMAFERGASIVRTHDVGPTVDALRMTQAVLNASLQ